MSEMDIIAGEKVRVYKNLHNGLFSIQARRRSWTTGKMFWRVVDHLDEVFVSKAEFKVSEAGRQRVLREKRKNVHAWVVGNIHMASPVRGRWRKVRYNPYEMSQFTDQNGAAVKRAALAFIDGCGIFASRP